MYCFYNVNEQSDTATDYSIILSVVLKYERVA